MLFLRNAWYAAAWESELDDKPLARIFLDEPVVLFRTADGTPTALADICPHRFAPLSLGKVDGDTIRCPYHGIVFDKAGACAYNPHGKGTRPASLSVRHYPLAVQQGIIWIWMGDEALAATTPPPDYPFLDDPNLTVLSGYLHVKANYELVTDNLMDLSHAEFLHPFISPPGTTERAVFRTVVNGEVISAHYTFPDSENTPLIKLLTGDHVERIDGLLATHWQAPANMQIDVGADTLGTPERLHYELPQVHLLTPETETSTHYLWSASRGDDIDPSIDGMLRQGLAFAFEHEDEPMIRLVQERMRNRPLFELSPALLPQDEAAVRARRILAQRIKAETEAPDKAGDPQPSFATTSAA